MLPKGIRTRPTPDWFVYYLSQMGFGNPPGGLITTEFQAIAIFNDSTVGSFLYIWGLSLIVSNADFGNVAFITGTVGAKQASGLRVNPSVGAPPGSIWWSHNGAVPFSFPSQSTLPSFVAGPGAYSYPIFVVPPGQSLVIFSPVKTDEFQVSCWYLPCTDSFGRQPV